MEQRLAQACERAWLVSRALQAAMQELRTAAQSASPVSGFQTRAVVKSMKQVAAKRRLRMVPRFGTLDWPIRE